MSVLVEGISVVVRVERIVAAFPGGVEGFVRAVPNRTLCTDGELARVGFMTPRDVGAFVETLEEAGLVFVRDGEAADLVVADQLRGFTAPCAWAEFGHVRLAGEGSPRVAACRLSGSGNGRLATPKGWRYEESLSRNFRFVPTEEAERTLRYLRTEDGVEVYLDLRTGEERYVGRAPGRGGREAPAPRRWH